MAGGMFLKMGQRAVEKKYGNKSGKAEKTNDSRGKKLVRAHLRTEIPTALLILAKDSFQYWGPKVEMRKDGQLIVHEKKVGAHRKDTAYYESLGLPHEDAKLLSRVKAQARWLDGGYTVPIVHIKFGVSAIIGLLPL